MTAAAHLDAPVVSHPSKTPSSNSPPLSPLLLQRLAREALRHLPPSIWPLRHHHVTHDGRRLRHRHERGAARRGLLLYVRHVRLPLRLALSGDRCFRLALPGFGLLRPASDRFGSLRIASDRFASLPNASECFRMLLMASDGF